MGKMIKLTGAATGDPIWVAADQIVSIREGKYLSPDDEDAAMLRDWDDQPDPASRTRIRLTAGDFVWVTEIPQYIVGHIQDLFNV